MKNSLLRIKFNSLLAATCFALGCFALSPQARAVCQEGCDLTNANTFLGDGALISNTTGNANTATGAFALITNTTGYENTASGIYALSNNTTGYYNTATGTYALSSNTTAAFNTATGARALQYNTTGAYNTATGIYALWGNNGSNNAATGSYALFSNSTGSANTANGDSALYSNTTGRDNTAIGLHALSRNSTGNKNIALGFRAGIDLTTGDKNIDIGNAGLAGESSTIRIGRIQDQTATFIAGISGATVPTGVAVIVDASGHLGTTTSSARFKEAIKPMDKASEAILALKPVTFRYKHDLNPDGIPQFGLVAEEVEKVNPDLVARDDQGKPYTVRYEAVNAMLLNEFLKAHKRVEEQSSHITKQDNKVQKLETTVAQQQKEIQALTEAVKAQAMQIRKVSDQLETQAPPMVVNN